MTRISGFTDTGQDRFVDIDEAEGGWRIDIRTPSGSGTHVVVEDETLSACLAGNGDRVEGIGRSSAKTLRITRGEHPRPTDVYLWIQGTSGNGWSIFVPPAELLAAVSRGGTVAGARRGGRGMWAAENRGFAGGLN
ncbi:MAG: hypothetical protein JNL28_07325 [Planctomycetes bacterium]|nr:hypothetical protein [Planctomycetota bacterium]